MLVMRITDPHRWTSISGISGAGTALVTMRWFAGDSSTNLFGLRRDLSGDVDQACKILEPNRALWGLSSPVGGFAAQEYSVSRRHIRKEKAPKGSICFTIAWQVRAVSGRAH
jgi:hypothetical protein